MTNGSATATRPPLDVSHPCWTGVEHELDHDWRYHGGDADVGDDAYWECTTCGEEDSEREPPSYDDDY